MLGVVLTWAGSVKVSELKGQQLDHWVAKAQGWGGPFGNAATRSQEQFYWTRDGGLFDSKDRQFNYAPSTNGGQCFALLSMVALMIETPHYARVSCTPLRFNGPTLNIAICRAFVASVYGKEVSE